MSLQVTLTRGPSADDVEPGEAYWVLRVQVGDREGVARLYGMGDEDEAFVIGGLTDQGHSAPLKVKDLGGDLLQTVVDDLMAKCGKDGAFRAPDDEAAGAFNSHWRVQSFKRLLDEYKASEKLTYDQAVQAVREYFVVEPVIKS